MKSKLLIPILSLIFFNIGCSDVEFSNQAENSSLKTGTTIPGPEVPNTPQPRRPVDELVELCALEDDDDKDDDKVSIQSSYDDDCDDFKMYLMGTPDKNFVIEGNSGHSNNKTRIFLTEEADTQIYMTLTSMDKLQVIDHDGLDGRGEFLLSNGVKTYSLFIKRLDESKLIKIADIPAQSSMNITATMLKNIPVDGKMYDLYDPAMEGVLYKMQTDNVRRAKFFFFIKE